MYIPITTALTYQAGGDAPSATCTSLANALGAAGVQISTLDASAQWYKSVQWVVASSSKAATYEVVNVIVDSKVDTQHRREDKQNPVFTAQAAAV